MVFCIFWNNPEQSKDAWPGIKGEWGMVIYRYILFFAKVPAYFSLINAVSSRIIRVSEHFLSIPFTWPILLFHIIGGFSMLAQNYESQSLVELRQVAKDLGLKYVTQFRKADLIAAILLEEARAAAIAEGRLDATEENAAVVTMAPLSESPSATDRKSVV